MQVIELNQQEIVSQPYLKYSVYSFFLLQLSHELLKTEVLNYVDVEAILGPPPFGEKKQLNIDEFDVFAEEENGDDGNNNGDGASRNKKKEQDNEYS